MNKYQQTKVKTPWTEDLFKVKTESEPLNKEKKELFHQITYQGLFLCKHGRADIMPAIVYYTTRVQALTNNDWNKLKKMMKFLKQTQGIRYGAVES